jgi:hypothetical protein
VEALGEKGERMEKLSNFGPRRYSRWLRSAPPNPIWMVITSWPKAEVGVQRGGMGAQPPKFLNDCSDPFFFLSSPPPLSPALFSFFSPPPPLFFFFPPSFNPFCQLSAELEGGHESTHTKDFFFPPSFSSFLFSPFFPPLPFPLFPE